MTVSKLNLRHDCETHPKLATAGLCAIFQTAVDELLQIALQTLAEVLEHRGATRQDDVLVQSSTDVDGRLLDDAINDLGERCQEFGRVDLGVEEDLGRKEAFVANIDLVFLHDTPG